MIEQNLAERYRATRLQSLQACEPLEIEDYGLQAEPFTSPPKWHLAHTSWFFETFLLAPYLAHYRSPDARYQLLFNSYYNGVGEQFARPNRGLLSRPTVDEVLLYREHVDQGMLQLLSQQQHVDRSAISTRTRLGIEHEKQHQELFYTDLKYSLSVNPLFPRYSSCTGSESAAQPSLQPIASMHWREYGGGLTTVGLDTTRSNESMFAFDNEGPPTQVYLRPFALANRLVTNAEFQAFIDDGGYQRHDHWLSDGWSMVQQQNWRKPLYWRGEGGEAMQFTLYGLSPRQPDEPVCHLSGYEADAYASWAGARLPTEFEWESAAAAQPFAPTCFNPQKLHPQAAVGEAPLLQLYSDCWQWTGSAYRPYSGFKASAGAIGEYNGKFMANQWVLRGGSCVSQSGHVRPSYRNFFYPADRWQFSGLRLAKDL